LLEKTPAARHTPGKAAGAIRLKDDGAPVARRRLVG